MFLSVIVPVYNSEKYLGDCLTSIRNQAFLDMEVLLIDDCSNDSSPAICKRFCKNDPRFRYHRMKCNAGTAASRNTGIRLARGEYLTFIDNDDWWEGEKSITSVYASIANYNRPDIICLDSRNCWSNGKLDRRKSNAVLEKQVACLDSFEKKAEALIKNGKYVSAVWCKIIKRSLIVEHTILFPEGKRNEDTAWSLQLLYYAKSIIWLDRSYYVWRRNTSVSQSAKPITTSLVSDIDYILSRHIDVMNSHGISSVRVNISSNFISYLYVIGLSYLRLTDANNHDDASELARIEKDFRNWSWLLNFDWDPRVRMVRYLYRIAGFNMTSFILAWVMGREKRKVRHK